MMRIINNWLNILFILSVISIASALVAEFFFDLEEYTKLFLAYKLYSVFNFS